MDESVFTLNGKVWLEVNREKLLGPGRVELLERIHSSGSIRQAALQMKMSYNQAWKTIKHLNGQFVSPIVVASRGGKSGGNATVTKDGLMLIENYHALQIKFREFLISNVDTLLK